MSASGRATAFMHAWGEGHGKEHNPGHKEWGADECPACVAEEFSPWDALVWAAKLAGFLPGAPEADEYRIDISAALDAKGAVPLSLNYRMHWAKHAEMVSRVKSITRNAVMAAEVPYLGRVHVQLHFRPKTNRFRDVDNIVATLKPAIDALHHRDTSANVPVPYEPIVDGDDARYVSWERPILHPVEKGAGPALWLLLRQVPMEAS